MTIDVREDWSGPQFNQAGSAWTAARKGTVACTGSDLQATAKAVLAALAGLTYPIKQNVVYKDPAGNTLSEYMFCESVDATVRGYGLWVWSARYSSSPAGRFEVHDSPLDDPIEFEWDYGNSSEPVDHDVYGNPIQNTNGDGFSNLPSKNFTTPFLVCRRNEPIFLRLHREKYINTVNRYLWNFGPPAPYAWYAWPGQALCRCIKPMTPITRASKYVRMEYQFEFRAPVATTIDSDGMWDSYKHREANVGQRCFYNNGATAVLGDIIYKKVTDGMAMKVGQDVRLAADGTPIESDAFSVQGANGSGTTPVASPISFPSNVIKDTSHSGIIFLKYTMYPKMSFADLNLLET